MLDIVDRVLGRDTDPIPLTSPVSQLTMARVVFREDSSFEIRKTWLAEVNETSILVPKATREDTTGYSHLTNDIEQGKTYSTGLLLADPEDNWHRHRWHREYTVRFKGYINRNNHITIPKPVREEYTIEDGDTVQAAVTERIIDPEQAQRSYLPSWRSH